MKHASHFWIHAWYLGQGWLYSTERVKTNCCLLQPAFGCSKLQMLVKIYFLHVFAIFWCKIDQKSNKMDYSLTLINTKMLVWIQYYIDPWSLHKDIAYSVKTLKQTSTLHCKCWLKYTTKMSCFEQMFPVINHSSKQANQKWLLLSKYTLVRYKIKAKQNWNSFLIIFHTQI